MLLDELAALMVASSVGTIGTDIFMGSAAIIPTGDGPYLSIIETGGGGSLGTQNNTAVETPTAQFKCRGTSYKDTRAMLKKAYDAVGGPNGLWNVTLSGVFYLKLKARQNITDLGHDTDQNRIVLVFNVEAEKQPS